MNLESASPVLIQLLERDVAYPLVPQHAASDARDTLSSLTPDDLFGKATIVDRQMAECCLSGLWLRFDFLDESHTISQSISTTTGSYWHAIMHRREPDWSNAKYWFHKVGAHEIFDDLLATTQRVAGKASMNADAKSLVESSTWDPYAFVDLCESASRDAGAMGDFCRRVQMAEWELLFDWCHRQAIGG